MEPNIIPATDVGTLYGLLVERARRAPQAPAYRQFDKAAGDWQEFTWSEALERADLFASAFAGADLTAGNRVAILLQNCVDWVSFDMGAHKRGLPVVPLYTNDAVFNTAFLLSDARPRVVLVDTVARWDGIAAALGDSSFIEQVWVQEAPKGAVSDLRIAALDTVLARNADRQTDDCGDPDATAVLIYTSGTTGTPKGAMLTHTALLGNAGAVATVFPSLETDVFLSILPLAHGFERTMGYVLAMMGGSCVTYAQSLLRLRQDLADVRPTVIMGVPRLYESIFDSAQRAAAKSPVQRKMFELTARIGWKRFAARAGIGPGPDPLQNLIWPVLERLVARRVGEAFGGRLRVAVSGGAAFPPEISRALVGLGVPMVEGYGLTEAGPVVTYSSCPDYLPGTVGFPIPGVETRIGNNGELSIRAVGVMDGYWQRKDATAEVKDDNGWLRTGDLAEYRGERIAIVGRQKHILVLSNGENVNPGPIESALEGDPLIDQVCVAGDGRSFLSALLVLNRETWETLARSKKINPEAPNAPEAEKVILPRIKDHLRGFANYQQIRAYHATFEEWTIERRLVTPTLKLRRERVIAEFESEIREIYTKG